MPELAKELVEVAGRYDVEFTADELSDAELEAAAGGATAAVSVDVSALVQWVLRDAYLENTADLQYYASQVTSFNEKKEV